MTTSGKPLVIIPIAETFRAIESIKIPISLCYRPQRSWGKVMFSQACVILFTGGLAWLLEGVHGCRGVCVVGGGMRGCWGACMVAGGCVWLQGGMCGCGGHAWLLGGVHGCWGACMVARGAAWLQEGGGMRGCQGVHGCRGGRHVWLQGGHVWGHAGGVCGCRGTVHRIRRDTVNERAVRILLECILVITIIMVKVICVIYII